jgi:flavin reductase (DIM6/NTAB) family NADH-FMN oxidoreductase RutF
MKETIPSEALNALYPINCVFVLSVDANGKPSGMIASWVTQTSFHPPLISVAIGKTRNTYTLVKQSREFVIAIANKALEPAVKIFGTKSGRNVDKFAETKIQYTNSKYLKTPILTDATFNFECKVINEVETGDHVLFIGEVVAAWRNEEKKVMLNMGHYAHGWVFTEF